VFECRNDDGSLNRPAVVGRRRQLLHPADQPVEAGAPRGPIGVALDGIDDLEIARHPLRVVGTEFVPQKLVEPAPSLPPPFVLLRLRLRRFALGRLRGVAPDWLRRVAAGVGFRSDRAVAGGGRFRDLPRPREQEGGRRHDPAVIIDL